MASLTMTTTIFVGFILFAAGYYGYVRYTETRKAFNAYSTAEQALNNKDLRGRTAIVTGSNTGIGKETARVLVKQGCNVIMACRTELKSIEARKDILKNLGLSDDYDKLTFMKLDLSSLESVETFVNDFNSKNLKIDYLINNAGITGLPEIWNSKDGFEMQFATNHLGPFHLTKLLLPNMLKNGSNSEELPRVINMSSTGERIYGDYNGVNELFDEVLKTNEYLPNDKWKSAYDPWDNYGISKSCLILFSRQLNKLYKDKLISVSLHPGAINTELTRDVKFKDALSMIVGGVRLGVFRPKNMILDFKSIEQGAATTIRCVSMRDDEMNGGGFYINCQEADDQLLGPSGQDKDGKLAQKVWQMSEQLIESRRG